MAGKKIKTFDDYNRNIEKADLQKDRRGYIDNENKVGNLPNIMKSKFDKNTRKWTDMSRDMIDDKIEAIDSLEESKKFNFTKIAKDYLKSDEAEDASYSNSEMDAILDFAKHLNKIKL